MDFIKIKNFYSAKGTIRWKDNPKNGGKYLQTTYLIKNYIQKVEITLTTQQQKETTQWKMDKGLE